MVDIEGFAAVDGCPVTGERALVRSLGFVGSPLE
jgi:hypothetical protein